MSDGERAGAADGSALARCQRWFDELGLGIAWERQERPRTDAENALKFSPFDYLAPDENRLSLAIAQLLDPRGTHGQGHLFLDAFLAISLEARSRRPGAGTSWTKPGSTFSSIRREARTELIAATERRKDIEIQFQHDVVVIENKPWAREQQAQIGDYLDELAVRRERLQKKQTGAVCCLYYLTLDGAAPASCKTQEQLEAALSSGHLRCIRYADLAQAWKDVLPKILNPRVEQFARDFVTFMQRNLEPAVENEDSLVIQLATQSPANIEAALRTGRAYKAIKTALIDKFKHQLRTQFILSPLARQGWRLYFELDFRPDRYSGISIEKSPISEEPTANCRIRYSFDDAEYKGLAYCIERRFRGAPSPTESQLKAALDDIEGDLESRSDDNVCAWWVKPGNPWEDWETSLQPWIDMASDQAPLAKNWISRAERMAAGLAREGLLDFFAVD